MHTSISVIVRHFGQPVVSDTSGELPLRTPQSVSLIN